MTKTLHILPSSAAVEAHLAEALAENGVLLGKQALTLKGLVDELFRASGSGADIPSPVGMRLLLERLVLARGGDLELLSPLQRFPGFVSSLESCFSELEEAAVTPDAFSAAIRRMPDNRRLREIAILYAEWQRLLGEKKLANPHAQAAAALEGLRRDAPLPPLVEAAEKVVVRGIYDFTPLQRDILGELSRRVPVEVELPYDFGATAAFAAVSRTAAAFEAMEAPLELSFSEPSGRFSVPLLSASAAGAPRIGLITAPGSYGECEEIGRRIRSLIDAGTDPRTIGVLFRDLREYGSMMEDVCRRFRIPLSLRRGAPLSSSPLVAAVLAPLEIAVSGAGRDELLGLLKSSYVRFLPEGLTADAVEQVIRASGYRNSRERSLEEALRLHVARLTRQGSGVTTAKRTLGVLRPLLREIAPFAQRRPVRDFAGLLERFIDRYGIFRHGIDGDDSRVLKRDASAILRFRLLLDDLERDLALLGVEDEFEPVDFLLLLRLGMEGVTLEGERSSGVSLMTLHDSRGLSFDHLFVGGLADGDMPPRHSPLPLFSDDEKLRFRTACGKKVLKTSADRLLEEPLLLRLGIDAARQTLTLTWPCADRRGNGRLRSFLLDEILPFFDVVEHVVPVDRVTPPLSECLEPEELLNSLALCGGISSPSAAPLGENFARLADFIEANTRMERERDEFLREEDAGRRTGLCSDHTGAVRSEEVALLLRRRFEGEPVRLSATALEDYGGCPFRYFARRLLGIFPLEEGEPGLEAREEGSLLHEILERFYRRMREEGRLPLRGFPEEAETARKVAEEVFGIWEKEERSGEPLLWRSSCLKLVELLCALVEAEGEEGSTLVPTLFEHRFDGIELEVDDTKVILHGAVDRIDHSPQGDELRVVDYKLGGDPKRYRDLLKSENMGRLAFQAPLYLLAALREKGGEVFPACSIRYRLIRKGESAGREWGEEDADFFSEDPLVRERAGSENFLNRVAAIVRRMRGGDFAVTPHDPDTCRSCDYGIVCRGLPVNVREGEGE